MFTTIMRTLAVAACVLLLSACGQKGNLYLPAKNPAAAPAAAPTTP